MKVQNRHSSFSTTTTCCSKDLFVSGGGGSGVGVVGIDIFWEEVLGNISMWWGLW